MNLTEAQPAIPTELHGFRVELGVGPYPPDQPRSDNRAMYAKLHPVDDKVVERMRHMGRTMVVAALPIDPQLANRILAGDQQATEYCGTVALMEASRLAKETVD